MSSQIIQAKWNDSNRINLLKAYQEHSQWEDQLKAMQGFFPDLEITHFFFQKNNCDQEFKLIMSKPCPTHKIVFTIPPPKYSRKDAIQNWIDFYTIQVEKQQKLDFQLSLVEIRSNLKLMNSVLKRDVKEDEIKQVMTMIETNPKRDVSDENKMRIETMATAIQKILEETDPEDLVIPEIPATHAPTIASDPNFSKELTEAIRKIYSVLDSSHTSVQPSTEDIKENEDALPTAIEAPLDYSAKLRKRNHDPVDSSKAVSQKVERGTVSTTENVPVKKSRGCRK